MAKSRTPRQPGKSRPASSLTVRLDEESKASLVQAAALRGISVSDYVRAVAVAQARNEMAAAREQTTAMTLEEPLAFWTALSKPAELTDAQRRLGALMRGES